MIKGCEAKRNAVELMEDGKVIPLKKKKQTNKVRWGNSYSKNPPSEVTIDFSQFLPLMELMKLQNKAIIYQQDKISQLENDMLYLAEELEAHKSNFLRLLKLLRASSGTSTQEKE